MKRAEDVVRCKQQNTVYFTQLQKGQWLICVPTSKLWMICQFHSRTNKDTKVKCTEKRGLQIRSNLFAMKYNIKRGKLFGPLERTVKLKSALKPSLVIWPLSYSEPGVDLVLKPTSLLLLCKSSCSYAS